MMYSHSKFHNNLFIKLSVVLFLILQSQFSFSQNKKREISENQKKITDLLKTVGPNARYPDLQFLINEKIVEHYTDQLKNLKPGDDALGIKYMIADQMLLAGKTEEAIKYVESLLPEAQQRKVENVQPDHYDKLLNLQALCYLRYGELINCVINHTTESCIYPIAGKGIYSIKEPTRKAIKLYNTILENHPEDLLSRWLLNIAYMTLGIYPDSVPKSVLIPYDALDAKNVVVPNFKDVSLDVGLNIQDYAGGVVVEDFNNDGYLDFFIDAEGFDSPCRIFMNKKDGTFEETTSRSGLDGEIMGRVTAQADYNNDGFVDLYVCRGAWMTQEGNFPVNSLFKNNGDGSFSDVTIEAGLLRNNPSSSVAWGDYDNDGFVDLFIGNETTDHRFIHKSRLYHNKGDGTFVEVTQDAGISSTSFTKSVSWGDYNNDGLLDLYISNISPQADNVLYRNNGKGSDGKFTFTDVSEQAGVTGPEFSFPAIFFDYDNDGWLDIFIATHSGGMLDVDNEIPGEYLGKESNKKLHPVLYHNNHDGTFKNVSDEVGLKNIIYAMSASVGDIDNDGYQDIYTGTGFLNLRYLFPNVMLRNNNGKNFQNVTTATGLGQLQKGHGIGFGDFDNDGDQDILASLGGGFTTDKYNRTLFENPGNSNHWITLKLEGTKSNRSALGCRIKVEAVNDKGEARNIYTTVASSGSFGKSCLRKEIGLGNSSVVKSVEIYWPASNTKQVFTNLKSNTFYKITEGSAKAEIQKLNKLKFRKKADKEIHHN